MRPDAKFTRIFTFKSPAALYRRGWVGFGGSALILHPLIIYIFTHYNTRLNYHITIPLGRGRDGGREGRRDG